MAKNSQQQIPYWDFLGSTFLKTKQENTVDIFPFILSGPKSGEKAWASKIKALSTKISSKQLSTGNW